MTVGTVSPTGQHFTSTQAGCLNCGSSAGVTEGSGGFRQTVIAPHGMQPRVTTVNGPLRRTQDQRTVREIESHAAAGAAWRATQTRALNPALIRRN
jgi:hypothetical protein